VLPVGTAFLSAKGAQPIAVRVALPLALTGRTDSSTLPAAGPGIADAPDTARPATAARLPLSPRTPTSPPVPAERIAAPAEPGATPGTDPGMARASVPAPVPAPVPGAPTTLIDLVGAPTNDQTRDQTSAA
jgi:hypothetical protein